MSSSGSSGVNGEIYLRQGKQFRDHTFDQGLLEEIEDVATNDDQIQSRETNELTLLAILKEMKKMNLYLSIIADTTIRNTEVE